MAPQASEFYAQLPEQDVVGSGPARTLHRPRSQHSWRLVSGLLLPLLLCSCLLLCWVTGSPALCRLPGTLREPGLLCSHSGTLGILEPPSEAEAGVRDGDGVPAGEGREAL